MYGQAIACRVEGFLYLIHLLKRHRHPHLSAGYKLAYAIGNDLKEPLSCATTNLAGRMLSPDKRYLSD